MEDAVAGKRVDLIIVGVVLLVLGGGGAWFMLGSGPVDEPLVAPAQQAASTTAPSDENISVASSNTESAATLVNKARMAVSADMIAEPPGQNALYFYSLALEADPDNAEIEAEFAAIETQVSQSLKAAVASGDFRAASTLAERLALANPGAPALAGYYDALESRRTQLEEAALAAAASGDDGRVNRTLREIRDMPGSSASRISDLNSRLQGAATRGAASRRAAEAAAQAAALAAAQTAEETESIETPVAEAPEPVTEPPITDVLAKIEAALTAGELTGTDGADQLLATARDMDSQNAELAVLSERWQESLSARARRELAFEQVEDAKRSIQALAAAPGGGAITAPLTDSLALAEATITARETAIPASRLEIREVVQPLYPRVAKRNNQEGWVEVAFTVNTDGRTADIEVLRTNDTDVFNKATIQAVSQWQFEPAQFNGTPIPQRVATRVVFRLTS